MEFKLNLKCYVMTTATTKTFFSVINIFTENTCIQNITDNNDAINNNLAEQGQHPFKKKKISITNKLYLQADNA